LREKVAKTNENLISDLSVPCVEYLSDWVRCQSRGRGVQTHAFGNSRASGGSRFRTPTKYVDEYPKFLAKC